MSDGRRAASERARLAALAREQAVEFQVVLTEYVGERLLARLGRSWWSSSRLETLGDASRLWRLVVRCAADSASACDTGRASATVWVALSAGSVGPGRARGSPSTELKEEDMHRPVRRTALLAVSLAGVRLCTALLAVTPSLVAQEAAADAVSVAGCIATYRAPPVHISPLTPPPQGQGGGGGSNPVTPPTLRLSGGETNPVTPPTVVPPGSVAGGAGGGGVPTPPSADVVSAATLNPSGERGRPTLFAGGGGAVNPVTPPTVVPPASVAGGAGGGVNPSAPSTDVLSAATLGPGGGSMRTVFFGGASREVSPHQPTASPPQASSFIAPQGAGLVLLGVESAQRRVVVVRSADGQLLAMGVAGPRELVAVPVLASGAVIDVLGTDAIGIPVMPGQVLTVAAP